MVGFDFDQHALERAFIRAQTDNLNFLPLFLDAANPSPDQGWNELERKGLQARAGADALIALAFEHHLAIARNIPLSPGGGLALRISPEGSDRVRAQRRSHRSADVKSAGGHLFGLYGGRFCERIAAPGAPCKGRNSLFNWPPAILV